MLAERITMEGDTVSVEHEIVPEYTLEYVASDWPHSDIAFWHWLYYHFDNQE